MNKALEYKIIEFSAKFNLENYLNKLDIDYTIYQDEELALNVCPFCKGINKKGNFKSFKCYINLDTKLFNCFLCGGQGNIIKLLAAFENKSIREIISIYLYNKDNSVILPDRLSNTALTGRPQSPPSSQREDRFLPPIDLPDFFLPLLPFNEEFKEAYDYMNDRGFLNKEIIETLDIKYSPSIKRIVFPVYKDEELVGWQARDITGEQEPKYLISKNFKKTHLLYNYKNFKDTEILILVEGIIDLVKCPLNKTTCLFGKTLSEYQFNLLLDMSNLKTIIIAIDPEENESRDKLYELLSPFFNIKVCILPENTDPGDYSPEEMLEYLARSSNYMNLLKKKI